MTRRGVPDWRNPTQAVAAAQVDAGLAAEFSALGFSRLDSLGRPLLFDDFRGALDRWTPGTSGAGAQCQALGTVGYAGPQAARLDPGSSGAGSAFISRQFSLPSSLRVGLEVALETNLNFPVTIDMSLSSGALNMSCNLRYDRVLAQWILPGVSNLGGKLIQFQWACVKIAADFGTGKFISAILPQSAAAPAKVSLATLTMGAQAGTAGMTVSLKVTGDGANQMVDFGYVVWSIDEP